MNKTSVHFALPPSEGDTISPASHTFSDTTEQTEKLKALQRRKIKREQLGGVRVEIHNPFKLREDPFSLSGRRILTKENIEFCNRLYLKAKRLSVLDEDEKIDRNKCFDLLDRLKEEEEDERSTVIK